MKDICMELGIKVEKSNEYVMQKTRENWNKVCKPLGSLGLLEEAVIRLSGIYGTDDIELKKRCAIIVCADNGVIAEGVTQSDKDVTLSVAESIAKGTANINVMGNAVNVDTYAVDVGIDNEVTQPGVLNKKIAYGTKNISKGPAMTYKQALQGIKIGIDLVKVMKDKGYHIITTGEMGIGNTTTSSAIASVILKEDVNAVTGRGAGLSSAGLDRKVKTIQQAIKINDPDISDPVDILSKLGGYDIAAMMGMFIGGAVYKIPIVIDGIISSISALLAQMAVPECKGYMFASHISEEPAGKKIMEHLELEPLINGHMRLGEGTGAICLLPLLDIALAEYHNAQRFTDTTIDQYQELK